jgi:hypothetical protein
MKTVKIHFTLDIEEQFPPIGVEILNAEPLSDGKYKLMNTPFFVWESAYEDIVRASTSPEGRLEYVDCVVQSTYKAISIILLDDVIRSEIIERLDKTDCIIEYGEFPGYKMLAIAVPENADYSKIRDFFEDAAANMQLSYAELVA